MATILGSTNWHVPLEDSQFYAPEWGSSDLTKGVGIGNLFGANIQTIYNQNLFYTTGFGTTINLANNTASQFLWFYVSYNEGRWGKVTGFDLSQWDVYFSLYDSNNKIVCKNLATVDQSRVQGGVKVKLSKWDTKLQGLFVAKLTLVNKINPDETIDLFSNQRIDIVIV